MRPSTSSEFYAELVQRIPEEHRGPLLLGAAEPVPAVMIRDRAWMKEQIRLGGEIWGVEDASLVASLWWYSASQVLVTPSMAALVVAGGVLSPKLEDVTLHHLSNSLLNGAASSYLLATDQPIPALAGLLRPMLAEVIDIVVDLSGRSPQSMWALATDSLANRALFFGNAVGRVAEATVLATDLAVAMGEPLPAPRFVDVSPVQGSAPGRRLVLRQSCCLLYRVPGLKLCSSCPRRHPDERRQILGAPSPMR